MTQAVAAHGTLLKAGDGAGSETFTTIAEVLDIAGPNESLDTVEVTSHDSANHTKEFIPTLFDGGEVTFDINFYAGATQGFSAGLYADFQARTKRNFQLVIPSPISKTGTFAAYITAWNPNFPVADVVKTSITLKVTGRPTWA